MTAPDSTHQTIQTITALLDGLPVERLALVEQFVRFLRLQTPGMGGPRYPTVHVSAQTLAGLETVLTEGYEGDALADTEALYDGDA